MLLSLIAKIILDAICAQQALNPALHIHFAYCFLKAVSVGAQKYVEFYEDDHEWGARRLPYKKLKLVAIWLLSQDGWDWIRFNSV